MNFYIVSPALPMLSGYRIIGYVLTDGHKFKIRLSPVGTPQVIELHDPQNRLSYEDQSAILRQWVEWRKARKAAECTTKM